MILIQKSLKIKVPNVIYTGYISDEKLVSLYRHAAVFVYPSLYEGFGIPPLEAMSQGCQVIVSTCASLPEVCGNNAMYCQCNNEQNLKELILDVLVYKITKSKIRVLSICLFYGFNWGAINTVLFIKAYMLMTCIRYRFNKEFNKFRKEDPR